MVSRHDDGAGVASAGGSRAAGGMRFQAEVFAWWAALAMSGESPGFDLDPASRVQAVGCETGLPVDDVGVALHDGGFILLQAKRGMTRLDAGSSDLSKAVDQLIDAFRGGLRTRVEVRGVDLARDRLVIATDATSSGAFDDLATVLARLRGHPDTLPLEGAASTARQITAWTRFHSIVEQRWTGASGSAPTQEELRRFYRVLEVQRLDFTPDNGMHRRQTANLLERAGATDGPLDRLISLGLKLAHERSWRLVHQLRAALDIPFDPSANTPNQPRGHVSFEWLHHRLDEAVGNLGPRYNRELTVDVPVGRVMAGFARREDALSPLRAQLHQAHTALGRAAAMEPGQGRLHDLVADLKALREPVDAPAGPGALPVDLWRSRCLAILDSLREIPDDPTLQSRESSDFRDAVDSGWEHLEQAVRALDGPALTAWNEPVLLITGEHGRGKSHLLADTAVSAINDGQPAVLLLGQHFLITREPWAQATANLRWPGTSDEFLAAINSLAKSAGRRALLMVDALNEGDGRTIWPARLAGFLEQVRRHDWIGVVLSVRTIAQDACVPPYVRDEVLVVPHLGFDGVEFDAVREFFRYYKLIGPATPLLLQEFREPLFLELFCRTAQQHPNLLTGAAPGLSTVLDEYLTTRDEVVAERLDTDPHDRVVVTACRELARAMHSRGRRWLSRQEAKEITERVWPTTGGYSRSLFLALLAERVLIESFIGWRQHTPDSQPVQFAYERLADHLIATNLIDSAHRGSHYDHDALARIAADLPAGDTTLDALTLLLPERVGIELTDFAHVLPPETSKVLPDRVVASLALRVPGAITDTVAELLERRLLGEDRQAARAAAHIAVSLACRPNHRLDHQWLHTTLAAMPMWQRDMTWTAATAGRRAQPSPYAGLLTWVGAEDERILAGLSGESALASAVTLMWAFTSSDRFVRDTATRRLVKIASIHPTVLSPLIHRAAEVDDLYVLERVCAAAYGVALRRLPDAILLKVATATLDTVFGQDDPPPHILIRDYAQGIVRLAHQRGLITDAHWARAAGPWSSPWPGRDIPDPDELERLYPLFADGKPARRETLWASIHLSVGEGGDFGRYIIGTNHPYSFPFTTQLRDAPAQETTTDEIAASDDTEPPHPSMLEQLVDALPEDHPLHKSITDLLAYAETLAEDEPHQEQTPVDANLVCRFVILGVADRGWTPERFRDLDYELDEEQDVGRASRKRERIGKKYQWQAWHEALARLADTHLPSENPNRQPVTAARISSTRDIDPSHLLTGNPASPANDQYIPTDAWWLPLSRPETPNLSSFDLQCAWVADDTALLDTSALVVVPGTTAAASPAGRALRLRDSAEWILLHGTAAWYWDAYGPAPRMNSKGVWADQAAVYHTVLIRRTDVADVLASPLQPYGPHHYNQSFADGPFLGEFPDQPAYTDLLDDRGHEHGWATDTHIPAPVLLTTDHYLWEGNIYDCSLTDSVSVSLPTAHLLRLLAPNAFARDGAVYGEGGEVIAFAPNVFEPGNSTLLIRADILHTGLNAADLTLGQVTYQERRSAIALEHDPWPGQTTRTSLHIHQTTSDGWIVAGTVNHDHKYPPRSPRSGSEAQSRQR
ncbi:ATPase AAA [Saccharothrix stipae]